MYKTDYIHLHRRTGTSSWVAVIESGKRLWYVGRGTYAAVIILPANHLPCNAFTAAMAAAIEGHLTYTLP